MEKIKLFVNEKTKIKKTTGLAPVISYEPWVLRSIESCKQTLLDGHPVLIRLHSGASYPCKTDENNYKLDMESHSVMIIGFDDNEKTFDVLDPWPETAKGVNKGIWKLSYELFPIVCVNSSLSKATALCLPEIYVVKLSDSEGNCSLKLNLGFYTSKGYIIDEKQSNFKNFNIELTYKINNEIITYKNEIKGKWVVGEYAELIIPIGKNLNSNINFKFNISTFIEGKRPYPYSDKIDFEYEENIQFNNKSIQNYEEEITQKSKTV